MPEQQQNSGQDNSLDFLWGIALVIGIAVLTWYFGKVYISTWVLHLRLYEIVAINFLCDWLAPLTSFVNLPTPQHGLNDLYWYIQKNIGSPVEFSDLVAMSTTVGNYVRYPLTLLMFAGAAWLYFGGATYRFRHTFDTKLLKNLEQVNWPQIVPTVKLDLINKKLDEAPWAFSLAPMQFCKKNGLLDVATKDGKYIATLRRGAAYRVLSLQLGPRWGGVEALPMYLKALFTIFALRINGDKKNSEGLLDQISASASGKQLDFSGVDGLLRKNMDTKKVMQIINSHAYVTTVLASMLAGARGLGVLATSEFVWLKPMDRRMWYILNSVGRQTAVSEICGAFAHWIAEKKFGLPLVVPMVEEGVRGLEIALSEIIYKPDEEE